MNDPKAMKPVPSVRPVGPRPKPPPVMILCPRCDTMHWGKYQPKPTIKFAAIRRPTKGSRNDNH
jgi:hypothetical protein